MANFPEATLKFEAYEQCLVISLSLCLSSREAAFKEFSKLLFTSSAHFCFRSCHPIMLEGIKLPSLAPVGIRAYNSWLLPHITIQPLHHDGINMY